MKNCKSAGTDSIINEVLKAIAEEILSALNKLFNLIYNSVQYPSNWRQALIVPIFKKKGDQDDPNCYRGIALISSFAKLFNNILNERLTNFLKKNKVISEFQIGFSKKARIADHMFVLRHLIDSHVKQNRKQISAAFIDFEKAFDTVWRDALLYKLLKAGIHGRMFNMIKSMYEETYYSVKCKDSLTTFLKAPVM